MRNRGWLQPGPGLYRDTGAVLLEFTLTLPMLLLVIFGGFISAYFLYAKSILTWHVYHESELYAARPATIAAWAAGIQAITSSPPPGLSGQLFWGITLQIPLPQYNVAVSMSCYRIPIALPGFGRSLATEHKDKSPALGTADLTDFLELAQHIARPAESGSLVAERQTIRQMAGWAAQKGLEKLCANGGRSVVTALAVARGEAIQTVH